MTALTDQAIAKIKDLIMSGEFTAGSKLPNEQDLSQRLGLSRNSLREAVRALTLIGVLEPRVGDGTYVTSLEPELLLAGMGFVSDLITGPTLLEPRALHTSTTLSNGQVLIAGGLSILPIINLPNISATAYRFNPATNTTLAIDFELFGTVLAEDAAEFQHHFETSNARIKEQITLTMHSAESADLTDAGLGLIKRQILEKTNRALGQPLLKEVLFSKFNFVER